MNKFIRFIVHPFVIAVFISILIILAIPSAFNKYEITQLNSYKLTNSKKIHLFHDLNHNGNSDEIYIHPQNDEKKVFTFFVKDHKGRVLDEWPIKNISYLPGEHNIFFTDINNNKLDELCFLGYYKDSIFLYAIEPYSSKFIIDRQFIQKVNIYDGFIDANVLQWFSADLNNDGNPEILFNLIAGYSLQPRSIYAYNYKNNTLLQTSPSGNMLHSFKIGDINDDGSLEIYGDMTTTGNCKQNEENCNDSIPFSDYASWTMIFDEELRLKYPVISFFGLGSWTQTYSTTYNDKSCLLVFSGSSNYQSPKNLTLNIVNFQGELLYEKTYDIAKGITRLRKLNNENQILIFDDKGCIYTLQNNRDLKLLFNGSNLISKHFIEIIDINQNGSDEVLIGMKDRSKLMMIDDEFKYSVVLNLKDEHSGNRYISVDKNEQNTNALVLQIGNRWYHFEYKKNPLYHYKFLIYFLIYIIVAGFFYMLFILQQNITKKKYEMEKELAHYQFRSLRNQLDPHFALNMLNVIQSLFYTKDFDRAKVVLSQYAKLNRIALMNADKIALSLEKELEFTESYLNLQRFRFDESFDYEIKLDEKIDEEQEIPRMLIHSFVENAIKYGIRELTDRRGNIIINAQQNTKSLIITIEDNGIGRTKAKEKLGIISKKGDAIIKDIVVLYNKLNKTHIAYEVSDILVNKLISGTKVDIIIPICMD